jgi:hypothetical protein
MLGKMLGAWPDKGPTIVRNQLPNLQVAQEDLAATTVETKETKEELPHLSNLAAATKKEAKKHLAATTTKTKDTKEELPHLSNLAAATKKEAKKHLAATMSQTKETEEHLTVHLSNLGTVHLSDLAATTRGLTTTKEAKKHLAATTTEPKETEEPLTVHPSRQLAEELAAHADRHGGRQCRSGPRARGPMSEHPCCGFKWRDPKRRMSTTRATCLLLWLEPWLEPFFWLPFFQKANFRA